MPNSGTLDAVTGLVTIDLRQIVSNWRALACPMGRHHR